MKGGSNRKPTQAKVLQGTFRKSRAVEQEPEFVDADISPPEHLEGVALVEWQRLAPILSEAGVFKVTDRNALEGYCIAYANMREAQRLINIDGIVVEGRTGGPIKNPACTALNEALGRLASFSAALGLDPVARSRINVGKSKPDGNPFASL